MLESERVVGFAVARVRESEAQSGLWLQEVKLEDDETATGRAIAARERRMAVPNLIHQIAGRGSDDHEGSIPRHPPDVRFPRIRQRAWWA